VADNEFPMSRFSPRPSAPNMLPNISPGPLPTLASFPSLEPPKAPSNSVPTAKVTPAAVDPIPLTTVLAKLLERATQLSKAPALAPGTVVMWFRQVRSQLQKIYGSGAAELAHFPLVPPNIKPEQSRELLQKGIAQVEYIINALRGLIESSKKAPIRQNIFIGHGHSPLWRELKDFLEDRLNLSVDEFNKEAVAGISTLERLEVMLSKARFAFLILTAEEQLTDSTKHARDNVIHEAGLFQRELGWHRAIVLLEEGCVKFSNNSGLTHIPFPAGNISACFEQIRHVLEREEIVTPIGSQKRM
jgi:Predicted nucleotide-binding protein containing TIR-like domain